MKVRRILFIFFFILSFSNLHSSNTPLSEIKDSIACFIKETEPFGQKNFPDGIPNKRIRDVRNNRIIEEGMNGIFLFIIASTHQNLHFLLMDDMGFQIINMRESLDKNIKILLEYFERNNVYSTDDIIFYISDMIRIYNYNEKEKTTKIEDIIIEELESKR